MSPKRPNPCFDPRGGQTLAEWHQAHKAYRQATGKCSLCGAKLRKERFAGLDLTHCPNGH